MTLKVTETLKQARFLLRSIAEAGPSLPSRQKWASIHDLAAQMDGRLTAALSRTPPSQPGEYQRGIEAAAKKADEAAARWEREAQSRGEREQWELKARAESKAKEDRALATAIRQLKDTP